MEPFSMSVTAMPTRLSTRAAYRPHGPPPRMATCLVDEAISRAGLLQTDERLLLLPQLRHAVRRNFNVIPGERLIFLHRALDDRAIGLVFDVQHALRHMAG